MSELKIKVYCRGCNGVLKTTMRMGPLCESLELLAEPCERCAHPGASALEKDTPCRVWGVVYADGRCTAYATGEISPAGRHLFYKGGRTSKTSVGVREWANWEVIE